MTLLLDLIYLIVALLLSPFVLFRLATSKRWRSGIAERMGGVTRRKGGKPCIWVHTVSVGEVNAAKPLLDIIAKELPGVDLVISCTTNTGHKIALERYGKERVIYFPLDLSFFVRRSFSRIRPNLIILVELEVWPNFLRRAYKTNVPVIIVNGRMREKWVTHYRMLRPFLFPMFSGRKNRFCVQNESYRNRFVRVGFPADRVQITGNVKYDSVRTEANAAKKAELQQAIGLVQGERLWVAGCTWPGEERICLAAHRELQKTLPNLRLAIAPRHIERADDVAREIFRAGYELRRISTGSGPVGTNSVALLDTMGSLGYLYALADAAFVGKSLTSQGGHNMLEPAALGTPCVFGPFTENFTDEARLLLEAGAAERVADQDALIAAVRKLLEDKELHQARAKAGRDAVLSRQGASRADFDVINSVFATLRQQ